MIKNKPTVTNEVVKEQYEELMTSRLPFFKFYQR